MWGLGPQWANRTVCPLVRTRYTWSNFTPRFRFEGEWDRMVGVVRVRVRIVFRDGMGLDGRDATGCKIRFRFMVS